MTYLAILGRQPALGIAELESRYGSEALKLIAPDVVQIEAELSIKALDQLGGVIKVAKLLTSLDFSDWRRIERYVLTTFPHHLHHIPEGKITLGISVYGLNIAPKQIQASALSLKKVIRQAGRSVRIVPNTEAVLNTAQVIHNKLTDATGHELLIVKNGSGILLAQTVWVQDIDAYRRRDHERPARDARVGMLPPKLAQIIINLSGTGCEQRLLDPFCGTGVLLQEGLLAGMQVYGTDLEPRMIEYSEKNLDWLCEHHMISKDSYELAVGDATEYRWDDFQVIVRLLPARLTLGGHFRAHPMKRRCGRLSRIAT
jgi:hypothetical protein